MNNYSPKTNRLHNVPTPTTWTGISGLIDICGILNSPYYPPRGTNYTYGDSHAAARADHDSLRSDWLATGDSIARAVDLYLHSLGKACK